MKKERMLSYKISEKLTTDDLSAVSAAIGTCQQYTAHGSHTPAGWDGSVDIVVDF